MLYIVLILVLGALGLLVTALITAHSLWAWVSIGLSVLAGLLLVVDFLRRRRKRAAPAAAEPAPAPATAEKAEEPAKADEAEGEQGEFVPEAGEVDGKAEPGGAPAEETSSSADVEVVTDLDVEVVVVDEYPRYHLTECGWLADRDTIPIAVKEARSLGFTPCARCAPDAHLAATHRASA